MSSPHVKHKVCPECGVDKLREEYYVRKNGHIMHRCKVCHQKHNKRLYLARHEKNLAYSKKYREENAEWAKSYQKEWRSNNKQKRQELEHRRRTRKRKNGVYVISPKDMRRLAGACIYCGSTEQVTMDHVVPISRGGTHGIGNLVPCCNSCNIKKNDKTVMEWRLGKTKARS